MYNENLVIIFHLSSIINADLAVELTGVLRFKKGRVEAKERLKMFPSKSTSRSLAIQL